MIETLDPGIGRQEPIVRLCHRPKVCPDDVIEETGYRTGGPAVVADQIAYSRDDPVAIRVKFGVRAPQHGAPRAHVLACLVGRIVSRPANTTSAARKRARLARG